MFYLFSYINLEIDIFQHKVKATSVPSGVVLEFHNTFRRPTR